MTTKRRIGIIGGTFDPIHYGHLILAEHVRTNALLEKVIFIPAFVSPHKQGLAIAESLHRFNMVSLAIASNPEFEASDMEISSGEISYTINTLEKLKDYYTENASFYFITGSDTIFEIEKWHEHQKLLKNTGFIVGDRPGFREGRLEDHVNYLNNKYGSDIIIVDIPEVDISSTDIKRRIKESQSIKYLVPESVEDYIRENKLYL